MLPQDFAGSDIHSQELTQVAIGLWIFVIVALDRTIATPADCLLHFTEGGFFAVQGHGDIQRIGLRAEGHRSPVFESGSARTHFQLYTNLRDLEVGYFAILWVHTHNVLITEISRADELAVGPVELPQDTQLAHFEHGL